MSKVNRILKRFITLLCVLIFSVENFAAIVSDNDGSTFVTKSEFEALKYDFESQIDNYNDSIDKKIDGAIAAYLAGINLQKAQSIYTVLRDWDNVTMRNYEMINSYKVPGAKISLSYYAAGHNSQWNKYPSAYGLALVGRSASQKAQLKSVILKEGKEENYNDLTKNKFYWNGVITDYEEKIAMSKLGYNDGQDVSSANFDIKLEVYDTVKLDTIDNGYYDSIRDFWDSKWKPLLRGTWKNESGSSSTSKVDWTPTFTGGFFNWSSQYKNDKIENKYELTWAAVDENVVNPDFSHCFYMFSDNTNTSKDMVDAMTINKAGTWLKLSAQTSIPDSAAGTRTGSGTWNDDDYDKSWTRGYIESHYLPDQLNAEVFDWTRGETSGGKYAIPTIGGLGPISSAAIYIQKNDFTYTFKDKDYSKEVTTMNDGFPLIYAKKDSELTWTCEFSAVKGSEAVEENGEVKVILSYDQFNDESESKDGNYVQADGTMGTTEYAFTSNKKVCKIKWTMQKDGWIYAKWFPAALTSSTAKSAEGWYITLDNTKSNKISYIDKS